MIINTSIIINKPIIETFFNVLNPKLWPLCYDKTKYIKKIN